MSEFWQLWRFDYLQFCYGAIFFALAAVAFLFAKHFNNPSHDSVLENLSDAYITVSKLKWSYMGLACILYGLSMWAQLIGNVFTNYVDVQFYSNPLIVLALIFLNVFTSKGLKSFGLKSPLNHSFTEILFVFSLVIGFIRYDLFQFLLLLSFGLPPFIQIFILFKYLGKQGIPQLTRLAYVMAIGYIIRVLYQIGISTFGTYFSGKNGFIAISFIIMVFVCLYVVLSFWLFAKRTINHRLISKYSQHYIYLFVAAFIVCYVLTEFFSYYNLEAFKTDVARFSTSLARVLSGKYNTLFQKSHNYSKNDFDFLEGLESKFAHFAEGNELAETILMFTKRNGKYCCNGKDICESLDMNCKRLISSLDKCFATKASLSENRIRIRGVSTYCCFVPIFDYNRKEVVGVLAVTHRDESIERIRLKARSQSIFAFMFLIGMPIFFILISFWNDDLQNLKLFKIISSPILIICMYFTGITAICTFYTYKSHSITQKQSFHYCSNAIGQWLNEFFDNISLDLSVGTEFAIINNNNNIFSSEANFVKFASEFYGGKGRLAWRFLEAVNGRDYDSFVEKKRQEKDFEDFSIKYVRDGKLIPALKEKNKVYWPSTYVYPKELEVTSLGLDFASEPNRKDAITEVVEHKNTFFLCSHAYYDNKVYQKIYSFVPAKFDEDGNVNGILVISFQVQHLLESLIPTKYAIFDDTGFRISEIKDNNHVYLLGSYPNQEMKKYNSLINKNESYTFPLFIGDSIFNINYFTLNDELGKGFFDNSAVLYTLIAGLLCSGFIAVFVYYVKKREDLLQEFMIRNEESIATRENFIRSITNNLPLVSFRLELDDNLTPLFVSSGIREIVGVPLDEFMEKKMHLRDFVVEEDQVAVSKLKEDLLKMGNNTFNKTLRIFNRMTKSVIWVEFSGNIVFDYDNNPKYCEGVGTDITANIKSQKALNGYIEELQKTNEELVTLSEKTIEYTEMAERAHLSKSMLLASVSHEIRTPMNAIIGMTDILKYSELNEEQSGYVKSINSSSLDLLETINKVLDFSKLDAGKMSLEQVSFDVYSILKECVDENSILASKKDLRFVFEYDDKIPPCLIGDPVRLTQVVNALLNNAIKFTQRGNITFIVEKEVDYDDSVILSFTVKDSGEGISNANIPYLFEPFWQFNQGLAEKSQGAGLGLSIASKLTKLMGGEMKVHSVLGRGTKFSFSIEMSVTDKCEVSHLRKTKEVIVESNGPKVVKDKTDIKILLAEDNITNQKVASALFKRFGYSVDVVENGKEAVNALSFKKYDIVFMDCQMPIMDGYEATRAIRTSSDEDVNSDVIIVAMTANSADEEKQNCLDAGMNDFLSKPIEVDAVLAILEKYFDARKN